ncbi:pectinesterase family protein [Saccharicrinis sp. FJH62]|uniref:pectinesterase family protein n=1 Tax=Saccharicrinis sp. FJH62 TaxID=3344657 RepID=UPI0035D500CC
MKKTFYLLFALVCSVSILFGQSAGTTYTYSFADGSEMPQNTDTKYDYFTTNDGFLTINKNSGQQFWYHDATHGVVVYSGNTFDISVAGNAIITFVTCEYSADNSTFTFTDSEGTELGTCAADNNGGTDAYAVSFAYTGAAGVITATLSSGGSVYIHGMSVENAAEIVQTGKIDVWDFGAEQLDENTYNNNLTVDVINSWYNESIATGSSGNVLPSFSAGVLSWTGGSNDRLRTSNTNLTRYDENLSSVTDYTGRVYVNSGAATGRFMSLTLSEDDMVTLYMIAQNGGGEIHFQYVGDPDLQDDVTMVTTNGTTTQEVKFVAKYAGTYHIFDSSDKPSYYRIYRQDAEYSTVSGTIDVSAATGIPGDYAIQFTNEAGKVWTATMNGGDYTVDLPIGYDYNLSLVNANGFVISSANVISVTEATTTNNVTISKVELYTVSGSVTGLGDLINNLSLTYTPDPAAGTIFTPDPVIDAGAGTYSVDLEPNVEYTISAAGVNDFYIPSNTITIGNAGTTADIVFEAKPVYNVTINATGLTTEQQSALNLTFTNLNEEGYVYDFASVDGIALRDGTYSISYSGVDDYPIELRMTSNLTVNGTDVSKDLVFNPVTNWSFDDKVISNGDPSYKGLLFTGDVYNEVAKGHLATKPDATIKVPVKADDKIRVTFYYSADFTIEGDGPYTTSSSSTSTFEFADYTYQGTEDGFVTITIGSSAGTTYITNIEIGNIVDYKEVITVGTDKDYQTINEALAAVRKMNRPNDERVTIMVDPGDYEEMLVVDVSNVSLNNASDNADIDLLNKGVDISENAVRVTSYYGHGYNYYSMGNDQKWNADILRVNKENGYLSYENKGAGTTNGSYWNATVVITAGGFEADHIIFENSYNQYISKKESEDVVVEWEVGGKGPRPTDYGNTTVQDRSFVERAAAIAITGSSDKVILNKCRIVGRQDSYYGAAPARVVMYKGAMMGAVDYIFGAMTAVFYKSDLVMNVSDAASDASYLTAAQQSSGRGYLMYECTVTSAEPGTESASTYRAKPGYFGRPWQATTSEVVFYNTTVETSNFPGSEGLSLISPAGWSSSLGGESTKMYEYGTVEESGVDNSGNRESWSTVLTQPQLTDGTDITTFNFTKGSDNWDPLPELIANDKETAIDAPQGNAAIGVYAGKNRLYVKNVISETHVKLFNLNGSLVQNYILNSDASLEVNRGLWIVKVETAQETATAKVMVE